MSKAMELAAWMNEGAWHQITLGHVEAVGAELRRLADIEHEHRALLVNEQNLREELERERMRLTACGVVAMANTRESAAKQRQMLPEYWSASCGDVERAVDSEMALREELAALKASLGVPVAQIVYASDECGTVEWVAHTGSPIRVGQNLYALTNKDQS